MPVQWVLITTHSNGSYEGLQYARVLQQGFVAYLHCNKWPHKTISTLRQPVPAMRNQQLLLCCCCRAGNPSFGRVGPVRIP